MVTSEFGLRRTLIWSGGIHMHATELIIFGIYLLCVVPAVALPLIWAAVLDGRHHANYIHRRATLSEMRPIGRAA